MTTQIGNESGPAPVDSAMLDTSGFVDRSCPSEFVTNVLKRQFGSSEEFLSFERWFWYQREESHMLKNTCEQLQMTISKLQEEKRSLEHQLVSERAMRDQESKNATMELEKRNMQKNAEVYSMECETNSWRRKAAAIATERDFLKHQLKAVEGEKCQMQQKLVEIKTQMCEKDRYNHTLETFVRRHKDVLQTFDKKLEDLMKSKAYLSQLMESTQNQILDMASHLRDLKQTQRTPGRQVAEFGDQLYKARAELAQKDAQLVHLEMTDSKKTELVDKLIKENLDLQNGLQILTKTVSEEVRNAERDLQDQNDQLTHQFASSADRLNLTLADFTPPPDAHE